MNHILHRNIPKKRRLSIILIGVIARIIVKQTIITIFDLIIFAQ